MLFFKIPQGVLPFDLAMCGSRRYQDWDSNRSWSALVRWKGRSSLTSTSTPAHLIVGAFLLGACLLGVGLVAADGTCIMVAGPDRPDVCIANSTTLLTLDLSASSPPIRLISSNVSLLANLVSLNLSSQLLESLPEELGPSTSKDHELFFQLPLALVSASFLLWHSTCEWWCTRSFRQRTY